MVSSFYSLILLLLLIQKSAFWIRVMRKLGERASRLPYEELAEQLKNIKPFGHNEDDEKYEGNSNQVLSQYLNCLQLKEKTQVLTKYFLFLVILILIMN